MASLPSLFRSAIVLRTGLLGGVSPGRRLLLLAKRWSGPICPLRMGMGLLWRLVRDVVVGHSAALGIAVPSTPPGNGLVSLCVFVVGLGVFENYVPRMDEAW